MSPLGDIDGSKTMTQTIDARTVFGTAYDLTRVGYVTDHFGYKIPLFQSDEGYHIDLGGSAGLTDPVEAGSLDEAIRLFEEEIG